MIAEDDLREPLLRQEARAACAAASSPARVRVFSRSHSSGGNDGFSSTSAARSNSAIEVLGQRAARHGCRRCPTYRCRRSRSPPSSRAPARSAATSSSWCPRASSARCSPLRPTIASGIVVAAGAGNDDLERRPAAAGDPRAPSGAARWRASASCGFGSLTFRISFETGALPLITMPALDGGPCCPGAPCPSSGATASAAVSMAPTNVALLRITALLSPARAFGTVMTTVRPVFTRYCFATRCTSSRRDLRDAVRRGVDPIGLDRRRARPRRAQSPDRARCPGCSRAGFARCCAPSPSPTLRIGPALTRSISASIAASRSATALPGVTVPTMANRPGPRLSPANALTPVESCFWRTMLSKKRELRPLDRMVPSTCSASSSACELGGIL